MTYRFTLVALSALLLSPLAVADNRGQDRTTNSKTVSARETERLEGRWQIVQVDMGGDIEPRHTRGMAGRTFTFADGFVSYSGWADWPGLYSLDRDREVPVIEATFCGDEVNYTRRFLYRQKGNLLILCEDTRMDRLPDAFDSKGWRCIIILKRK